MTSETLDSDREALIERCIPFLDPDGLVDMLD